MRFRFYLICSLLLPYVLFADAGFNIRRTKAPCYVTFSGIEKPNDFLLIKVSDKYENESDTLNNKDTMRIYYAEGEKRWNGPIKLLVLDTQTQQFVDSFTLIAEGYNLAINFTVDENKKVKYTIEKTKAEYPYSLTGDEKVSPGSAVRNKYILISLSAIALLILLFMFFKRSSVANNTA